MSGVRQSDETAQRRVPVNGSPHGTIAWSEHHEAWESYARRYGTAQGPDGIARRGGFGLAELVTQLGHMPQTWKPSEATRFLPGVGVPPALIPYPDGHTHPSFVGCSEAKPACPLGTPPGDGSES